MKKILILEDSYLIRQEIVALLTNSFQIYTASNAHQALLLLDKHQCDWLILNPVLGGNSGLELVYELDTWPDLRRIKILLVTSDLDFFNGFRRELTKVNVKHLLALDDLNKAELIAILG